MLGSRKNGDEMRMKSKIKKKIQGMAMKQVCFILFYSISKMVAFI
jgi:hypothetical protein